MNKSTIEYTVVKQKNGVVRKVPKTYSKPLGKTKTVSMTLPITLVEAIEELANETTGSKSKLYTFLLSKALEERENDDDRHS